MIKAQKCGGEDRYKKDREKHNDFSSTHITRAMRNRKFNIYNVGVESLRS